MCATWRIVAVCACVYHSGWLWTALCVLIQSDQWGLKPLDTKADYGVYANPFRAWCCCYTVRVFGSWRRSNAVGAWNCTDTIAILNSMACCLAIKPAIPTASITSAISMTYTFQIITQDQIMHSFQRLICIRKAGSI